MYLRIIFLIFFIFFIGCSGGVQNSATTQDSPTVSPTATPSPPTQLSYSQASGVYKKGIPIPSNSPSISGGSVTSYSISPQLPGGLLLDSTSGVISGTPTEVSSDTTYIVTASNAGGSTTASLKIKTYFCPTGYVLVPARSDNAIFISSDFCVAKYIASSSGSVGVSVAEVLPWVSIYQNDSITACRANNGVGETHYDLISNAEWQAVARNVELVESNWSENQVGSIGGLNRGHSENHPSQILSASSDDSQACSGLESVNGGCSDSVWNIVRRTFSLNNGDTSDHVIWDLAGNVKQWVKDDNDMTGILNNCTGNPRRYVYSITEDSPSCSITIGSMNAKVKTLFGPSGNYTALSDSMGGLGIAILAVGAKIQRGGSYAGDLNPSGYGPYPETVGIFGVDLSDDGYPASDRGFRCVYHP